MTPAAIGSREHRLAVLSSVLKRALQQCRAGGGAAIDIVGGFRVEKEVWRIRRISEYYGFEFPFLLHIYF